MTQLKKGVLPLFCALISTLALSLSQLLIYNTTVKDTFKYAFDTGPDKLIVFIALTMLFIRSWETFKRSSCFITHALSALLSAFLLIGKSYTAFGNWGFIFASRVQFIIASIAFLGSFILIDVLISCLYSFLSSNNFFQLSRRPFPEKIEKRYTLFVFCVIVLCWLPYYILYMPGSIIWDSYWQLNQAFGVNRLSNHHPWVLTLVYGLLMRLGRPISDNFGVFITVFSMLLAQAFCYAAVCRKIKEWETPFAINVVSIAFFALFPPFGAYAQVLAKDSIYTALFALFFVLYADICLAYLRGKPLKYPKKAFAVLFFVELAVCLTRNNGIHIVLPADILLFAFMIKGQRRYALTLTLCIALSYFCVENVIAPAVGVRPGGIKEMLSIPFQQTARYLKEYPEDVTKEERAAIGSVLRVHDLAAKYNPELSDPVKNTYHAGRDKVKLAAYFKKAWFPMLCRHPGVYIESLFNNTFGYYYPFSTRTARHAFHFQIEQNKRVNTGFFKIHYVLPEKITNSFRIAMNAWRRIPVFSHLISPGTYTWLLLVLSGFLFYCGQYRKLLTLVPLYLTLAVCMASPVNGSLRYALPLVACSPALFCFCSEHSFRTKIEPLSSISSKANRAFKCLAASAIVLCLIGLYGVAKHEELKNLDYGKLLSSMDTSIISQAYIDIANEGLKNDVSVIKISDLSDNSQMHNWVNKKDNGCVITSGSGNITFKLKCKGSGKFTISLLGRTILDANQKRHPLWVYYDKLVVDGTTIFDEVKPACRDMPYKFTKDVKNGQIMNVQVSWILDRATIGSSYDASCKTKNRKP